MRSYAHLTLVSLLILGLAGCSVREAEQIVHKAPRNEDQAVPDLNNGRNGGVAAEALGVQTVKALDTNAYADILEQTSKGNEILSKVVEPLAKVLLSPAVYTNRDATASNEFFRALRELNLGIMKLAKVDLPLLKRSGVLSKYKNIIFFDCDLALRGTCSKLNIFAREAHLPRVLVIMAKEQSDVLEYYRLLYAALERGRPEMDQDLNYLYLNRHQELARLYLQDAGKENGHQDREILRMHARVLQNILADFDPDQVTREQMDQLMERFNPWDVSRRTSGMSAVGVEKLLGWAAKGYLYSNPERTKLDDKFVGRVSAILDGTDSEYGKGLRTIHNEIKASASARILENFGLIPDFEPNEYLYLVDRLYYGHFSTEDATALWSATGKDKAALFKAMNQFVRLQIANMIVWTNGEMNTFFATKGSSYKDLIQLLRGAINNSLSMHVAWERELNRIDSLVHFVDREYGKIDPFLLPDSDEYKQFSNSIMGLRHNIKMLSVYPNMMMIVYLMGKKEFQATINTFWGTFTITPYEVIKWFFIDVMAPWFSFGTDSSKLSQVELLYAMHFSLVTETFSSYKDNPVIPVTEAEFFGTVVQKLVNDQVQSLLDDVKKFNAYEQSNAKYVREALAACREERVLQPQDQPGAIKPRSYVRVFAYENMTKTLANGFPNNVSDTQLGALIRFHSTLSADSTANNIRTEYESRILFVRNMLGIIKDYLNEIGADTTAVDEAYTKEVAPFIENRNELLKKIHQKIVEFGDCDVLLYKHEKDLRDELFRLEEAYLTKVFDRVSTLNALLSAGQSEEAKIKAEEFNAELKPTDVGLPQDFVDRGGYDRYVENASGYYFNYHKFDAFLRLRRNLRTITPNTEITLPNFDKLPEYQVPTPVGLIVASDKTKEEQQSLFVGDGMRKFMEFTGTRSGFSPQYMLDKIDLLTELYRIGPVTQNGELGCTGDSCLQVTPEQIIRQSLQLLQIADISEGDNKIMNWLGVDSLLDDSFWDKIAMETGNRRHLGLLDLTFQRLATDNPTVLHGPVTTYFLDLTKKYYDTEMSVGHFFFEPRPSIKQMIKKNYAGYVSEYEAKVEAFLAAYEELRKDPSLQISGVRRSRQPHGLISVKYEKGPNGEDLPIYITTERKNRYTGAVNLFHERTSFEFKNAKP